MEISIKEVKPLDVIDSMDIGSRSIIPSGKLQTYKNAATNLKRFKQKQFVVRAVNTEYIIFRIA